MPNEIFFTKIHSSSSYKTSGRNLRMARATKALPTLIQAILSLVRQFKSSHGRVARVLAPTLNTHTLSMYNVMLCSHTVVSVVWLQNNFKLLNFCTCNTHGGYSYCMYCVCKYYHIYIFVYTHNYYNLIGCPLHWLHCNTILYGAYGDYACSFITLQFYIFCVYNTTLLHYTT